MTPAGSTLANEAPAEAGARVPPLPPSPYFVAVFAGGPLLRAVSVPIDIGGRPATVVAGAGTLVAGMALALGEAGEVVRYRTHDRPAPPGGHVDHHRRIPDLAQPMYAGLAVAYLGAALLVGSRWPVVTLPVALVLIRLLVIGPEERYLDRRFGPSYVEYRSRVRRWL